MKKKIFLLLILLFTFIIKVNASTTTYDRNEKNNLGVNKKWKITYKNKSNVLNTPYVDAKEKIYDFSNIITDDEEKVLYDKMVNFIEKYNTDIVILTYDLPYSYDKQNEDFAADFYDYNDFALNNRNYSGILLFRNTYSNDPYFDIYMFGDAQLYISTNRADDILDIIYNDLHNGNYLSGFGLYISKVDSYYNLGIPSEMKDYYVDDNSYLVKKYNLPVIPALITSIVITLVVMLILIKKNKMIKRKINTQVYLNNVSWNKKEDIFINSHVTSYTESDSYSSGGGGGGFSSSSGSSGGGHSSGGGRHG